MLGCEETSWGRRAQKSSFLWDVCHEADEETKKVWLEEKGGKMVPHMRYLMFWGADSPG